MKPRLTMLCGLPGSGKTTLFQNRPDLFGYGDHPNVIRISLDEFRLLMTGKDFHPPFEPAVHSWAEMTGRYLMSQGVNIVIDATSVRKSLRVKWIKMAREFGYETACFWMNTPYYDCIERNAHRDRKVPEEIIRRMSEDFEEPSQDEGFDILTQFGPSQ